MPVFNDIKFIEQSLQSILAQNFSDFILVLSDDGSTDGSAEVCIKYQALDKRICYIKQKQNLGISKNMEFLIRQAATKYFMWAADDDIWHPDFALKLIELLESNSDTIASFCNYHLIDETNKPLTKLPISRNYRNSNRKLRLENFIKNADDGFGYGVFLTEKIRKVEFPVWWWPNQKTAYNNIFPTLCYYLVQGNFILYEKEVLFFKREKSLDNTNHLLTGSGNGLKEIVAFIIRRFNLITFSTRLIRQAGGAILALRIYVHLFNNWFIKSSFEQIMLAIKSRRNK